MSARESIAAEYRDSLKDEKESPVDQVEARGYRRGLHFAIAMIECEEGIPLGDTKL